MIDRIDVTCPREQPRIFIPLVLLFSDALRLPQGGVSRFPSPEGMGNGCQLRYRALLAAFEIKPHGFLLRVPNRRLFVGPRV